MKKGVLVVLIILSLLIITGCSRNDVAKPAITNAPVVTEEPAVETATPSPAPKTIEDQLTIGDTVLFGSYEQDGNEDNGAEPLEWIVIDEQEGNLLLLTKCAIDVMDFAPFGSDARWVISPIREWLNNEFYQEAFTDDEKALIQVTTIKNFYRVDTPTGRFAEGKEYMAPGKELFEDEDTEDRVFLLSDEEAEKINIEKRTCSPTQYALDRGAKVFMSGFCSWWLRSIGISQKTVQFVMQKGDIGSYNTVEEGRCVRPAIWITTGE